jgi:hypothetical protein
VKHTHRWIFAGLAAAALPLGSANAGTLDLMPNAAWAERIPDAELKDLRGTGPGIAFDISVTGSIDNLGDLPGSLTAPPDGFGLSVSNGVASITTQIGGINGNGIFIFNQVPGNLNVINTTVVVNVAINGSLALSN